MRDKLQPYMCDAWMRGYGSGDLLVLKQWASQFHHCLVFVSSSQIIRKDLPNSEMLWSVKRNIDLLVCSAFIYIEFYYGLGTAKEKISNIMKLTFK